MRSTLATLILATLIAGCTTPPDSAPEGEAPVTSETLSSIAESYVRLVLALGEHDEDYVDAYYGPPQWREQVRTEALSIDQIRANAESLLARVASIPRPNGESLEGLRHDYLGRQLEALHARTRMLAGERLSFDEESRALYDAVAPHLPAEHFDAVLARLDAELPGVGPLTDRLEAFRREFTIPKERLDDVFKAAIDGCRARTVRQIDLPEGESFTVEYVTGKSWSGYNWYQGNYQSLIQVNTDLPIFIDRAIDLACHEGYPGHHAYNVLLEKNLVRDRGWVEYTVYALFSPQSLIAEGTANFGIDVAFPKNERVTFERSVLFPLAGLDPARADHYYRIHDLTTQLAYAGNEAARRYLDGEWSADEAVDWLVRTALSSPERARQRVRFFDQYRSYVINYNLGRDLVREHVEARGGTADRPEDRWQEFADLISSPRLPSGLNRR